jgi:hypothetical protein
MFKVKVTKIVDGLGFGKGSISHDDRTDVDAGLLAKVEAAVTSEDILVPVDKDKSGNMLDDDGCGDGRGVRRVLEGATKEHSRSLNRAKVFGGGSAMVAAIFIGIGKAKGKTLSEIFTMAIASLHERFASFGAHTDTHAQGDNTGCGAIDKAPAIIINAVEFQREISGAIASLGIDISGLDAIFSRYQDFAARVQGQTYIANEVMQEIASKGKIIKELDADHREMYIVLNTKYGYTVNQRLIREVSDGKVQVFAVDVWRLQELVRKLYPIDLAAEESLQQKTLDTQHIAFLAELVYTLSVAATLTKGDLPVYVVSEVHESAAEPSLPVAA